MKELARESVFSDASFYLWRSKFGRMEVPGAKRWKSPEVVFPMKKTRNRRGKNWQGWLDCSARTLPSGRALGVGTTENLVRRATAHDR